MYKRILIIAFYSIISAGGLTLLKYSFSFMGSDNRQAMLLSLLRDWYFITGAFLYGSGFIIWLYLLSKNELSWIFPVAASSLIVITSVFGVLFLREGLLFARMIGILIILVGIFVLNLE